MHQKSLTYGLYWGQIVYPDMYNVIDQTDDDVVHFSHFNYLKGHDLAPFCRPKAFSHLG